MGITAHPNIFSLDIIAQCDSILKQSPQDSFFIYCPVGIDPEPIISYLYQNGPYKTRDFVRLNFATIPNDRFEYELFGYSGNKQNVPGKIDLANGAEFYIYHIEKLPLHLQATLLEVLSEQGFYRVEGAKLVYSRFRVICIVNQDPWQLVQRGKLYEDLYWQIAGPSITIPPLSANPVDIRESAIYLAKTIYRCDDITEQALAILIKHPLPGNQRQLKAIIARASALAKRNGNVIDAPDIISSDRESKASPALSNDSASIQTMNEIKKMYAAKILELKKGNITHACQALGISEGTLRKILKSSRPTGQSSDSDDDSSKSDE